MSASIPFQFDRLNQFACVARHQSFARAAIELGMQPSTLSRHIAALERALGLRLLHRTTRAVQLSADGAVFLDRIAPLFEEIGVATSELVNAASGMAGLVRIATTSTMADICILPILPKLQDEYPEIRVEFVLDTEIIDMRARRIDFAVRAGVLREKSQVARRIGRHGFGLYCAPALQERKDAPMLTLEPELSPDQQAWLTCEDFFLIRKLVVAGQGIAWMPDAFCLALKREGKLLRLPEPDVFGVDVFIAYPEEARQSRRARLVMDKIIHHAREIT